MESRKAKFNRIATENALLSKDQIFNVTKVVGKRQKCVVRGFTGSTPWSVVKQNHILKRYESA